MINIIKIFIINTLLLLSTAFPQKTLSVGLIGEPKSILPHEAKSDTEKTISNLVFRKLFKYEGDELILDLVDSWSASDNKQIYTIKLKDHQKWQDGENITSDDIIYSLSLYENLIKNMEIEKNSDLEITITLSSPTAILPSILTISLEPSHLKEQSKLQPIGSTSFRVARVIQERRKTEGLIIQSFQKNKSYNKLIFRFYQNENDLKIAYKIGDIIAFYSNTLFKYPGIREQGVTFLGRYFTLIFNTTNSKLEDPEVRNILAKSLNVEELLKSRQYYTHSLQAQGPISYSFVTKDIYTKKQYNPSVKLSPAQEKIVDELKVLLPNNQDGTQIQSFLEESWEKNLGIKLITEFHDLDNLSKQARDGKFDVLFVGLETTPDPDRYEFWHSSQVKDGLNFAKFKDLRADKALEEGRKVFYKDERIHHYNIFQDVMSTKTPAVFLYHPGKSLYISNNYNLSIPQITYHPWDIFKNL